MSVTSHRSIDITFEDDVVSSTSFEADDNTNSPCHMQVVTLVIGDSTIQPRPGTTVPTAVTILKPADNTATLKLKGNAADTGIVLHPTDPDSISLASSQTFIILNTTAEIDVRLIWT